jgi:hypothetical protein
LAFPIDDQEETASDAQTYRATANGSQSQNGKKTATHESLQARVLTELRVDESGANGKANPDTALAKLALRRVYNDQERVFPVNRIIVNAAYRWQKAESRAGHGADSE